jgi:hypothetical protein
MSVSKERSANALVGGRKGGRMNATVVDAESVTDAPGRCEAM